MHCLIPFLADYTATGNAVVIALLNQITSARYLQIQLDKSKDNCNGLSIYLMQCCKITLRNYSVSVFSNDNNELSIWEILDVAQIK